MSNARILGGSLFVHLRVQISIDLSAFLEPHSSLSEKATLVILRL